MVRGHFEEVLIQGAFTASPELGHQLTRPGEEKSPFVTIYFLRILQEALSVFAQMPLRDSAILMTGRLSSGSGRQGVFAELSRWEAPNSVVFRLRPLALLGDSGKI